MKKLILIALISLFAFPSCNQKTEKKEDVSTYYLIRHAEKNRTDPSNHNPELIDAGLKRAENWAKHFKDIKFDAVYSTDYNRTKQTALPTAKQNNLEIQLYNPSDLQIEAFIKKTKGKTVLVVGHSNTTPKFANGLLGEEKYDDMADDNNGGLYIITVSKSGKTTESLVVN
ncbi:SixA phosphatase family protein [Winogradskyella helgolandensis]|uniref:SixA phosphatase family protein n=1 Tax=Winogradskyella helgolandensis TaxID=2697010 RepID=UPI0015CA4E9B|nr:phosphoglycerate mutase family protein [Winogradskyella helgolandensis]